MIFLICVALYTFSKPFFKLVNTELFLSPEPKTKFVISTSKVKIKRYSEGRVEIKDRKGRKERKEMCITYLLYSCGYLAKFTNLFIYLFIYLFIQASSAGLSILLSVFLLSLIEVDCMVSKMCLESRDFEFQIYVL